MKNLKNIFKIIKENIIYLLIIIAVIIIMNINLPFSVYSPGGLINIEDRLTSVTYKSKGSFNMTYVTSRSCNIPTCLLGLILPEWDIIDNKDKTLENETIKEAYLRDRIYLYESISNATYVAYTYANKNINIIDKSNYITYIYDFANTNLTVGDKIVKINNNTINNYDDILNIINNQEINDKITITVLRDDKEVECLAEIKNIDGEKKIGIAISEINEYEKSPNIDYIIKFNESGSSGGLMLALAMYDSLTNSDLTKGLTISGTGTINSLGEVGEIAGVKYKLSGAVKSKSEVFLVPDANYEEAVNLKKKYNYDIKIIKAINFEQVLEELANL